jgi:hypothetical protein
MMKILTTIYFGIITQKKVVPQIAINNKMLSSNRFACHRIAYYLYDQ